MAKAAAAAAAAAKKVLKMAAGSEVIATAGKRRGSELFCPSPPLNFAMFHRFLLPGSTRYYHSLMKENTICINPHKLLLMTMVEDTITKKVAGNICSSLSNARVIGAGICSFSMSAPRGYRRAFFTNSFEDMGILKDMALVLHAAFKGWKTKFQDIPPMKKYVMLLGLACLTLHLALHYKMKKMETNLKQDMIKFRAEVKLEIEAAANAMQKEIASGLAKSAQFRADSVVAFQKCKARPDVWSEYYCLTLLEALMRSRIDGK
ncbi:hypothetical protein OsI_13931 [Oryza sativa Indica Group]|uniref:Uncharacterized protein n=2 Tax=Oryza TaxID=4527 RepID=A0A0E0GV27_ORYNI|nr:hypothetical protein OsI_13931 [Oryza sativa Indica Group]